MLSINLNMNLQSCAKACLSLLLILLYIRRFSRREESSVAEIHTRTPVLAEDTELGVGRLTGDIVEVVIVMSSPGPKPLVQKNPRPNPNQDPIRPKGTGLILTLKSCGPPTSPTFLQSMRIT